MAGLLLVARSAFCEDAEVAQEKQRTVVPVAPDQEQARKRESDAGPTGSGRVL